MTAALNFLKNAVLFVLVIVVVGVFLAISCVAVVFHGLNYLTRSRKLPDAGHGIIARWR